MRKITQLATQAFLSLEFNNWENSNTKVIKTHSSLYSTTTLLLHGHDIAKRTVDQIGDEKIEITNAGYFTNVTKERLNGIPGVRIQQKAGTWYLNGTEWNGDWTTI